MLSVVGTYQNGKVKFAGNISSTQPIKVVVTFLEEVDNLVDDKLELNDFSFLKSRDVLRDMESSLAETVVQERRSEL